MFTVDKETNYTIPGLTNLWHACPMWNAERFPSHAAFNAVPFILFVLADQRLHNVKTVCVHTHICVQTVHKLRLLPNNTASETFLHESGALRSVDFITEAPAWRWLGEYVTLTNHFTIPPQYTADPSVKKWSRWTSPSLYKGRIQWFCNKNEGLAMDLSASNITNKCTWIWCIFIYNIFTNMFRPVTLPYLIQEYNCS